MMWRMWSIVVFSVLCWASGVLSASPATPAEVSGCKPLHGVTYDPFARTLDEICLPEEQVIIDVQIMATVAKSIRIYSIAVCPDNTRALLAEAQKQDMVVLLGVFIGGDAKANEAELKLLKEVLTDYPSVIEAIVVGSDAIVSGKIGSKDRFDKFLSNVEVLIKYINRVKKIVKATNNTHPVTTAEEWRVWESEHGAALIEAIDFICLKVNPFSEGRPVVCALRNKDSCISAATYANARATGLSKFYSKEVWMCETSWPTAGERCCFGVPSERNGYKAVTGPAAAGKYLNEFVKKAGARPYYIASAFDRDWRRIWNPCANCLEKNLSPSSFENGVCDLCDHEYLLGIFDEDRERKTEYEIPTVKCALPSLPKIRVYTPPPAPKEPAAKKKAGSKPAKRTKETENSKKGASKSGDHKEEKPVKKTEAKKKTKAARS